MDFPGLDRFKTPLVRTYRLVDLISGELQTCQEYDLTLRERLWLWRHGFRSESGVFFDFDTYSPDQYLTNYQRDVRSLDINGRAGHAVEDKLTFHKVLARSHPELVPEIFCHIQNDKAYDYRDEQSRPIWPAFADYLAEQDDLIVKPRGGGGGSNVLRISSDTEFRLNGSEVPKQRVQEAVESRSDALVTEFVQQADYAKQIAPHSTNSIRILSMIDPETREPFIARAVHRFGTATSAPADNWSSGGAVARVDEHSGQMSQLAYRTNEGLKLSACHPESGQQVAGVSVPGWETVLDELRSVAETLHHIPYIGWDIVVTDDGDFRILEGNHYTDIHLLQVHEPLLTADRVRRFYSHHDII